MVKLTIIDKLKNKDKRWKTMIKHTNKIDCLHCKYKKAEDSIPKEEFTIKNISGSTVTIKEIKLVYGRHDDIIGWSY